ncbi:MAG TPA: YciK family oxidoreductase [Gammaproteobacteria bacterium]
MKNYQPKPDLLKDRVVLVTGAGDGIGAAAAKAFARHGATVVLLGRTVRKLEKVYDEIKAGGGPEAAIYPLNLEGATVKDYEDMALAIKTELGRLDGILHNAGILGETTPIRHYPVDVWQKVMHVNLTAPFMLTRVCLDLLQQSQNSRVIFTTHRMDTAYWGAYGISKAAIESLMKILADELENSQTTVNAIEPGEVQSPMMARTFPGKNIGALPAIDSILPAYLYLMGPDSSDVNGKIIEAQKASMQYSE